MDNHSPGVLGILYAEDFGADNFGAPPPPPEPEYVPEPAPPALTEADVDAACHDAVAAAEAAWAAGAVARRTAALESLAAGLVDARRDAEAQAEAVADGLARTALSMVAGLLPHLCRAHGDAEVSALLHQLLPALAPHTRVVVRVHAGLLDALRDELDRMGDGVADQVELRPANLPPGDARLSWDGGSLHRDTAALCAAMTDSLLQLGLLLPDAPPPATRHAPSHATGSLAHV